MEIMRSWEEGAKERVANSFFSCTQLRWAEKRREDGVCGVCGALLLAAKIMSPAATKRKLCEAAVVSKAPPTSPLRENIIICRGPAQENSEIKADPREKRRRLDPPAIR